jgi:putative thioredoxin
VSFLYKYDATSLLTGVVVYGRHASPPSDRFLAEWFGKLKNDEMETEIMSQPQPPSMSQSPWIKDSDTARFGEDVVNASLEVPVIVDFWAPWCEPCKDLGPVLEKTVEAANGAVRLVKINVDENQELAAQLRVQSIPAVFAFKGGQPVDGFMGVQPESQIKAFIEKLGVTIGPSPMEELFSTAEIAMAQGDLVTAESVYRKALDLEPNNIAALGGLIICRVKAGDVATAQELFDSLTPEYQDKPELAAAKAALALAGQGGDSADIEAAQAHHDADPENLDAHFELACALLAQSHNEEGAGHLLDIIKQDREWNDAAARKQLLTLFEALGPTDQLTISARKALSSMLFS